MTLVLMAAFADGRNESAERAEIARIAQSLSRDGALNVAAVYQEVLLKRVSITDAATVLTSTDQKRLAYELAVGVCTADGGQTAAEHAFLTTLQSALGFDDVTAASERALSADADALAAAPMTTLSAAEPAPKASALSPEEQDRLILNYAILNGGLELLPDSLASMAIVPLQMRMVYRLGQSYGVTLDRQSIKEFIATAGVGMASQYVEQIGVKLVGAFFGRGLLGGLLRGVARQSVSSGLSFATTYALGRLAVGYYAGGRTLSAQVLQETYAQLLREAKGMEGQYLPAMQEKARTVNVAQLLHDLKR